MGVAEETFCQNKQLKDACHANLIIISEAIARMSKSVKYKYAEVDWKQMAGFKNLIAREYFRIDWILAWQLTLYKLQGLKSVCKRF